MGPAPSPTNSEEPNTGPLATIVNNTAANAAEVRDAIQDLQDKSNRWKDNFGNVSQKIDSVLQASSAPLAGTRTDPQRPSINGNPGLIIQHHLPWIDQSLLSNIISLIKDLIQLLPIADRPKRNQHCPTLCQ